MQLIIDSGQPDHVSEDIVKEFEAAILSDPRVQPAHRVRTFTRKLAIHSWGLLQKLTKRTSGRVKLRLPRSLGWGTPGDYFAVLIGVNVPKCLPYFMFSGRKSIYVFDAWPRRFGPIKDFVEYWKIRHVFLSSSMAAEHLSASASACTFSWIPEGVDPSLYRYYPVAQKNIDVLQLGRKYDLLHESIVRPLQNAGKIYLYEKTKGEIVFPTRSEFIEGLARSKISLCFPSSMTHPHRSGDIETMTNRYLQSMVSRCLVVGHAPKEMVDLFGYNPVVELEMQNAADRILAILNGFEAYVPLIERNYQAVLTRHTWHHRWNQIADILFPRT